MTSWISVPHRRKEARERFYTFQTDEEDFCTQFNQYLYAALVAKRAGLPLKVYDQSSSVSIHAPILKRVFQDGSGIEFVDTIQPNGISLNRVQTNRILSSLEGVPQEEFRTLASQILEFNSETRSRISELVPKTLPLPLDLGVHIRSGAPFGGRAVPIAAYLDAVKDFQKRSKKTKINLYLFCETAAAYTEFRLKADPSWTVYGEPYEASLFAAYSGPSFKNLGTRQRLAAYDRYVADLSVLQTIPDLIGTMSSSVGKFLYLTHPGLSSFKSLDVQTFSLIG
jgi:hypothetical protein